MKDSRAYKYESPFTIKNGIEAVEIKGYSHLELDSENS